MRGRERRYRLVKTTQVCRLFESYGHVFECHIEFDCTVNQEKE